MRKVYPSSTYYFLKTANSRAGFFALVISALFSFLAVNGQNNSVIHQNKPLPSSTIVPHQAMTDAHVKNDAAGPTTAANSSTATSVPTEKPSLHPKWIAKMDNQIFIENKGQFSTELEDGKKILYRTMVGGATKVYFLPDGVYYKQTTFKKVDDDGDKDEVSKKDKDKKDAVENDDDEKDKGKASHRSDPDAPHIAIIHAVSSVWAGSNPNVVIKADEQTTGYHTYAEGKSGTITAYQYKKITYQNMYPGIDIEYTFPAEGVEGIKYAVIVHPGADLSQVKLNYANADGLSIDKSGNVNIQNEISIFTDHAPVGTYQEGGTANVAFTVTGKEIGFAVKGDYDKAKTLIIDPWTTTNLNVGYNVGYDVDYDNAGNVFVGGGYDWYEVSKFNPAGTYQWTYACFSADAGNNGGYDITVWGDFAVDKNTGYMYCVEGFNPNGAWAEKVDPSGNFVARYTGTGQFNEMWRAEFNSCTSQIAIGGGGTNSGNNDQVAVLDESMATLTPQNPLGVGGPGHDVVGLTMDPTGSFCYMCVAQSGWYSGSCCPAWNGADQTVVDPQTVFKVPVPALTPLTWQNNDSYGFQELSSVNYVAGANGYTNGMNCMAATPNYLYMYDGKLLSQLSKANGATIASRNVTGGSRYNQGGICGDGCDDVYVGSGSTIYTYGPNIAGGTIASQGAYSTIYDLVLGPNDATLYATGNGFVEEFTNGISTVASTVSSITNTTCGFTNGSATASLSFCGGGTPAGTTYSWSPGGQTTQTATNLTGGVTYTVTITIGCGDQYTATAYIGTSSAAVPTGVSASSNTPVCAGGTINLFGGATGATSWQWFGPNGFSSTSQNPSIGGVTAAAAGTYTLTASNGCGSAAPVTTPVVIFPAPSGQSASSNSAICSGNTLQLNGSGTNATSWSWSGPNGFSSGSQNPTIGGATVLASGTYTLSVINACGTVTATTPVTVNPTPTLTANAGPAAICAGGSTTLTGGGATTYTWTPGGLTGSTISVSPGATATYTVNGTSVAGCPAAATQTVAVTVNTLPVLTAGAGPATICAGGSTTLTGSGASTYTWTPGALTGSTVSVSPGSTQTYTLNGTSAAGCAAAATQTVAVTVNPLPTLNITSPPPTICSGNSTTLSASGATTYTWTPGGMTGSTVSVSPGSTQNYTVTGTSAAGCVAAATQTVAVTVNATPTLTIGGGPAAICSGGSVNLTGSGASTYTWTPNTSISSTTGPSVTVTPTVTITYTLNGTSAAGCPAAGTKTTIITVSPAPILGVSASSPTICSGNPTTLTGSNATTYTWTPSATLSASTGASVTATPLVTTTYTLNGTASGCAPSTPVTVIVTVNTTPTLTISGPATICSGNGTTLTGSGASTYTWTPNTNLTASTGSPVTASPTTTQTYTLNGTSAAGCAAAPKTEVVTVNATPTLTIGGGPASICSGGNVTLTGSGASTYTWTPNTSISATTGTPVTVTPTVTITYTLNGTSAAGCPAAATKTTVITVSPTPVLGLSASSATICSGSNTTLTGSNATTYTWTPSATLSASTGAVVTATPLVTTTYTLNGTAAGCSPSTPVTVVVTVNATPTLTISGPATICSGKPTTLTGGGATTYTWTPNTSLSSSTGSPVTATPTITVTYTLNGTSAAGCPASGPKTTVITVNTTPTVTASASSPTICSGNPTTLTASGAATYTWTPSTALTASTGSPVTATPSVTITYTLNASSAAGCAAASPQTVTVTVNTTPTISVAPLTPTICPGGNVNITASGATTYTWTPSATLSASTGATVNATPVSTTTYTITGNSAAACPASPVTEVVSVAASLPVSITPGASSICSGGSTVLNAGGAATYVWSPTTGLSCSTCPNPTANPADTTTYKVVGSSGACKDSATFTLIVNPTPTVGIALTGISAAICPGDSMGMIASGASTYVWTPSTGLNCSTCSTVSAGPMVSTTYTLTGKNGSGCSATATQAIVVYPVPVMTINITAATICSGNSVILKTGGVGSYSWSPPTGLNVTLGDSVVATPSVSTTYTVTGVGTGGCKTKDSAAITVNITPTVTLAPPAPLICSGDSIKIIAGGAPGYTWLPNSGLQCNTCDSTKVSPPVTTTYSVVGTSLAGCKDTGTITVNVNATPTITITASNGTTICSSKDTTVLTANGGTTYKWLPATGLNDTIGSVVDANPTTTVVYTVSTTSAAGCPSKDSVTIMVNPTPTVNAGAVASTICSGTSTVLNASGATQYTWTPTTGLSSNTGATVTASPGTTQTYSVIGVTNGCPDTAIVPVTVVAPPVVTATIAGGDSLCSGLSKTITASGAGSYIWKTGGQTTDSIVVSPVVSTTYTVVGSNGTCTDSAIVSIGLYPPFTVAVTNDTLCSGRTANITATATGGSAPYTYLWSNGLGTNASANILVTPGAVTYTCNVSNACGQTFPATVVVDGAPTPSAVFTATPDTIPGGQLVGFLNSNSAATSWQWTMGDNSATINGDSSIVYQYNQPGTYWIKLVVSNGFCTDTDIVGIYVTEGIFIPNVFTPNGDGQNDIFHVTVGGMKQYHIEIFNRWGERIFQADAPDIDWDGTSAGGVKESDGDYYYMISCTDFKNTTFKYHGYIQLIRN